jgi:hypothetical protein
MTEGDDPMKFMERFIFFLLSCITWLLCKQPDI